MIELLPEEMARVSLDGVTRQISVAFVGDLSVGDYVILHVGFAIARVDAREAERTLAMIRDAAGPES